MLVYVSKHVFCISLYTNIWLEKEFLYVTVIDARGMTRLEELESSTEQAAISWRESCVTDEACRQCKLPPKIDVKTRKNKKRKVTQEDCFFFSWFLARLRQAISTFSLEVKFRIRQSFIWVCKSKIAKYPELPDTLSNLFLRRWDASLRLSWSANYEVYEVGIGLQFNWIDSWTFHPCEIMLCHLSVFQSTGTYPPNHPLPGEQKAMKTCKTASCFDCSRCFCYLLYYLVWTFQGSSHHLEDTCWFWGTPCPTNQFWWDTEAFLRSKTRTTRFTHKTSYKTFFPKSLFLGPES